MTFILTISFPGSEENKLDAKSDMEKLLSVFYICFIGKEQRNHLRVAQQILTKKWISKTSLYDGQDSMYEAQKISHSVLFAYSLLRLIST